MTREPPYAIQDEAKEARSDAEAADQPGNISQQEQREEAVHPVRYLWPASCHCGGQANLSLPGR
jgi:hypothetical protein